MGTVDVVIADPPDTFYTLHDGEKLKEACSQMLDMLSSQGVLLHVFASSSDAAAAALFITRDGDSLLCVCVWCPVCL